MYICKVLFFVLMCTYVNAQIIVSEYSASNLRSFPDNFGKHEDWIELQNTADDPIDISGWYLSDKETKPKKWKFPASTIIQAKGYLLVWASGRDTSIDQHHHTNFKFTQSKGDEFVVLADKSGKVIESSSVILSQLDHSIVKTSDKKWRICTKPTPGSANDTQHTFLKYASKPSIDKISGFYSDSIIVSMSHVGGNEVIRFTLDGSLPNEDSPQYIEPIVVKENAVIHARNFAVDTTIYPGFCEFRSYFINEPKSTLPIISIGAGQSVIKLAEGDAEQTPIGSIEVFSKDGQFISRSYGELDRHGQDSWVNNQRSLDWISRDEMGYSNGIPQKLFHYSDRNDFQRIILRASGDDNYPAVDDEEHEGSTHIRDEFVHAMVQNANMHMDVRASERYILYLNGRYWGVYAIREKPDDHDYTNFAFNQDKYELQFLKTWGTSWAEYGDNKAFEDWEKLREYILKNDLSNADVYNNVTNQLDVISLMDYMIANLTCVSQDWLNYNTGWWRGLNPKGDHKKWGYIMWDNDATFGYYINYTGIPDSSPTAKACDINEISLSMDDFFPKDSMLVELPSDSIFIDSVWTYIKGDTFYIYPDPGKHEKIFLKLLQENTSFRQQYFARYADVINSTFNCERMHAMLDSMINEIKPEMPRQIDRWGGTLNEWNSNINKLRDFVTARCQNVFRGITDCYEVTGPFEVQLQTNPPNSGSIRLNTFTHTSLPWKGNYFGNMKNEIQVLPIDGRKFLYWQSKKGTSTFQKLNAPNTTLTISANDTLVAVFEGATFTNEVPDYRLQISPVPASEHIFVNTSAWPIGDVSIHIYKADGTLVDTVTKFNHNNQVSIPISDLTNGAYLLKAQTHGSTWSGKFIVVH